MAYQNFMKKIMTMAVIGVLVVVGEIIAVRWFVGKISARVEELHEKQAAIAALERDRLEAAALERDYQLVKNVIPRLETAFPVTEAIFGTVSELDRLANYTGNRQTLVVEGQNARPSAIQEISFVPFSASLTGSYQSFRNYLKELRVAPFFVRIDSISISASDSILGEGAIKITGSIFLR